MLVAETETRQRSDFPGMTVRMLMQCPDEFVVGYGLDYNEEYRSLPYVGVLKPQCYQ